MTAPTPESTRRRSVGAVLSIVGEAVGFLVQVLLLVLGFEFFRLLADEVNVVLLLAWCLVGTLYLIFTIIGLNIVVRLDVPEPALSRAVLSHPAMRWFSMIVTFGASAIGLWQAFVLLVSIGSEDIDPLVQFSGVWTMLLSWAIFQWGFARIYYSLYHRARKPPLLFPGTEHPRLTDFVYFSFTNATAFSVSDVQVVTSRMRWTVVWHTAFAFLFNAVMITLAVNVILRGDLFSSLL